MSDNKEQKQGQINIELDETLAEGVYSNLAIINHSVSEFVIDFVSVMPGTPKSKVKSRVVMAPHHVKGLIKALTDNLKKYENNIGKLESDNDDPPYPLTFGPSGQA